MAPSTSQAAGVMRDANALLLSGYALALPRITLLTSLSSPPPHQIPSASRGRVQRLY